MIKLMAITIIVTMIMIDDDGDNIKPVAFSARRTEML